MPDLLHIITAADPAVRNRSLESACRVLSVGRLLEECRELDRFRRRSDNLYERVRALFFLSAIHRFHLPAKLLEQTPAGAERSRIPFTAYEHLLQRRFEEAIDQF